MSNRLSSLSIILILIALGTGALSGYYIQSSQNKQTLSSQQTTITTQLDLLTIKDQAIDELEQTTDEYNTTIISQLTEINEINEEIAALIEAQQNEPDVINSQAERITELENELEEKYFEILTLNARLGDRLNWKQYSKHDISFEYPEWMELSILDSGYDLGTVLSINWIDPMNYFYYSWQNVDSIEAMLEEVEDDHEDIVFDTRNTVETKVDGHDAFLYFYNVTVGDGSYHGMLCVWECPVTNRFNVLFQYSSGDPYSSFLQILSTVKCHVIGEAA